ncbi:very long chain fatty acid elongase 6-like [Branchiostoma floridae x Branchiostoma japonicum]
MESAQPPSYAGLYPYLQRFERDFDYQGAMEWMDTNWTQCVHWCVFYVLMIVLGQRWMQNRTKYTLRGPLIGWNLLLGMFSVLGTIRFVPPLVSDVREHGFEWTLCSATWYRDPVLHLWGSAFAFSKVLEFGDTVFIILRKQKLIFLHWYHHVTVLFYVWLSYKEQLAGGRWFIALNYGVHATMYMYYAARAAGIYIPRKVAMVITSSQTLQMVIGCVINYVSYKLLFVDKVPGCSASLTNIVVSSVMYFSYLLLFLHFFYGAYVRKSKLEKKEQ